jgi:hypothetical protein
MYSGNDPDAEPIRALMAEMMLLAINDLSRPEKLYGRGKERDNRHFATAEMWVRSLRPAAIPFSNACSTLGIDATKARKRILSRIFVLSESLPVAPVSLETRSQHRILVGRQFDLFVVM